LLATLKSNKLGRDFKTPEFISAPAGTLCGPDGCSDRRPDLHPGSGGTAWACDTRRGEPSGSAAAAHLSVGFPWAGPLPPGRVPTRSAYASLRTHPHPHFPQPGLRRQRGLRASASLLTVPPCPMAPPLGLPPADPVGAAGPSPCDAPARQRILWSTSGPHVAPGPCRPGGQRRAVGAARPPRFRRALRRTGRAKCGPAARTGSPTGEPRRGRTLRIRMDAQALVHGGLFNVT